MYTDNKLIFWGAGATAELGMPTTDKQADFIRNLVGVDGPDLTLRGRVDRALDSGLNNSAVATVWKNALYELIEILGDTSDSLRRIDHIGADAMEAMRSNWMREADDDELRRRIIALRLYYDWPALKSVVRICPASSASSERQFKLNDLFNVIDMHIDSGVPAQATAQEPQANADLVTEELFFEARRLVGARNALKLILTALFHIAYQVCLSTKRGVLAKYRDFAVQLGRRGQRQAIELARCGSPLDHPEFYQGDVGFVSLNYDPIGLWI